MTTPKAGDKPITPGSAETRGNPPQRATTETAAHAEAELARLPVGKQPPSNLSLPRSPLIGRDHEIAAVQHLLLQEQVGLLTLTGPGGIGKTRLAMQVAANLLDHFVDGVYFISLAPISDPNLVAAAIAQPLGVREAAGRSFQESLHDYLREKQLLLVLDNFEQVVTAAPGVGALLAECHRLKVLVTSRATLHLYGEHEFSVPPLALPDRKRLTRSEAESATNLTQYAAVELFCQWARTAKSDFALTATNAAVVAEICIGLDGLPLAIELAAAKIKLFSPFALLARLQQRLTLLIGGPHDLPARQRTLRDEIAWSYDLLANGEQTLFRRLAVFVGGFTLAAAQAVGNANGDLGIDVLDGVASLVDKNLLRQGEGLDGEPRFGMLETIREFGLERLAVSGELEAIHRQHVSFFLTLAEEADPKLRGAEQLAWLQRLEADYANLQAALAWSLREEEPADNSARQQGLRLTGALSWFWLKRTRFSESRAWCERALALSGPTEPGPARARALQGAGIAAQMQGDFAHARRRFEESLSLWQELEDQQGRAFTLIWLARAVGQLRDLATARAWAEASLVLYRELGDSWGSAFALHILGRVHKDMGDHATARPLSEESLRLFRALGDAWGITDVLRILGEIAFEQGDYTTAHAWLEEGLVIGQPLEDKWFLQSTYYFLGVIERRQGKDEQAVTLFEQSLTLAREIGAKWWIPGTCSQLGFSRLRQGDDRQATLHFRESLEHLALIEGPRLQTFILSFAGLAAVAARQQQWERAARLCGSAEGLYVKMDIPLDPGEQADYDHHTAAVWTRRHEPLIATAWAQGQHMALEEAVTFALTPLPVDTSLPATRAAVVKPAPELQFCALGTTRVQRGEHLITASEWTYAKARELLFYLLCHPPRTREQIGLVFWPDASPTQLRNNLGVALHHLRRALGRSEWIVFADERYTFNRTLPYWFDLEVFEAHLTQARQHRASAPASAITHLEQAVALNQGNFLEDCTTGDWYSPPRERVHKLYIEALLTLGELLFSAGHYERAAAVYQQAIARDEYLEAAHHELIRCYARQGERGQALRHYQHLVEFMREELDLPPDTATTALVDRMRQGEEI
jgi:predicted ATPase/DNA-binding SARP family transcriptional activator